MHRWITSFRQSIPVLCFRGLTLGSASLCCFATVRALAQNATGAASPGFRNPQLAPDARIADLLSQMTLEEKIDCLGTNTAIPRLHVKSFGSSEGIHGVVQRGGGKADRSVIRTTQFPQPPGMGETWDPALVQQAGSVEGAEGRYISDTPQYNRQILMLWGPQADLARDPRWGRSEEVYGEDPFLNGTMVTSFIHGLQGDDPNHWQAAALMKHFLANSNEDHRTKSNSIFDQRLFWEYYSVPFRMGFLEGGAKGVMASYNAWNGTPMAVNPILKSIVEDQWGADVLSSDGGAVKLLWTDHKRYPDQKAAVIACLHDRRDQARFGHGSGIGRAAAAQVRHLIEAGAARPHAGTRTERTRTLGHRQDQGDLRKDGT